MLSFLSKRFFAIVFVGFMSAIAGCASPVQSHAPTDEIKTGMVYALPKGQVQFIASRKKVTDEDVATAQKALADITAALAADKKALAEAKVALVLAQGAVSSAEATVKDELVKRAALAKAVVDYLTIKVAAEGKSAAAAEQQSKDASASEGKWVETASLAQLAPVADATRRFVANLDHGFTRNDKIKISVAGGLLSTTSATSDDQSVAIILNMVQGVAAFSGASVGLKPTWRTFSLAPPEKECKGYSYSAVFDPVNAMEVQQVYAEFKRKQPTIRLTVVEQQNVKAVKASESAQGLVYRAPRAVRMNIEADADSESPCKIATQVDAATFVAVVPDSAAEFVLGTRAGPFTKTVFDFAFKDGMPTDYAVEQPSELVAIASLPLDIAKAIVSVPASIIKLRIDYDSQANAAVDAKTAMLKARLAQLNAQQALDEAMGTDK